MQVLIPEFVATQVVGDWASVGDFNEGDAVRREDGADGFEELQRARDMLEGVAADNRSGSAEFLQDGGGGFGIPVLGDNFVAFGQG